jgi:hypothetical protein
LNRVRTADFFAQPLFDPLSKPMHVLDRETDQTGNLASGLTADGKLQIAAALRRSGVEMSCSRS